jgi:hypothetical protein
MFALRRFPNKIKIEWTNHSDNLSLHLPHPREDIRMDGVGHSKHFHGLCLQSQKAVAPMIDRTADLAILPPGPLHLTQSTQLGIHLFARPWLFRQGQVSRHAGPLWGKLVLDFGNRRGDLLVDLGSNAWGAEEEPIGALAKMGVGEHEAACDAVAADLVEEDAQLAKEEQDEDEIAKTGCRKCMR